MNNELLLLNEKHTDKFIEQTKTKPQETLELKMKKQMQIFSFNPPINLLDGGKWMLAVSLLVCAISVFNITEENNSYSINIPGHWVNKHVEKTINKLNKFLELRSLELHVNEVRKRGKKIKLGDNEGKLSDTDTQKMVYLKNFKI